ncbi:MAG: hypothetical protein WCJ30_18515, partial [Deltaproteobacteria bacterium]
CGAGMAAIHFQHLPVGNGTVTQLTAMSGVQTITGTTVGTGTVSGACCDGGPEDTYWFVTCPAFASLGFEATTCGGATWDTDLDQRSASRATAVACNDDSCGLRSRVTSTLPAGAGIHTFYVDGCGVSAGAYTMSMAFGTACTASQTLCAAGCADLAVSTTNCGACGTVCAAGQACTAGVCGCPAGQTLCGTTCVDTQTDGANCGTCGTACAAGQTCVTGVCTTPGPANDTRAGATTISMASTSQTLTTTTTGARNDTAGSCGCTSGSDVFFTFTLTAPEIVYADTITTTWDTSLFLQSAAGANLTADASMPGSLPCNDDGGFCSLGLQSQIATRLAAGTYYLVLSGCGSGAATIHFQHLPVGNGPIGQLAAGAGATIAGTTSGTGLIAAGCCSGGPENTYWWATCPASAGGAFSAATCGGASWDTDLEQRSATRATVSVCNDDSCGLQSSLASTIPAGAGLHTFYVDGCDAGAGAYTVTYTRP